MFVGLVNILFIIYLWHVSLNSLACSELSFQEMYDLWICRVMFSTDFLLCLNGFNANRYVTKQLMLCLIM